MPFVIAVLALLAGAGPAHAEPISLAILGALAIEATATAVAVTTFVITTAASLALSFGMQALNRKKPGASPTANTQTTSGTQVSLEVGGEVPRSTLFGRAGIAGQFLYANTSGPKNEILQLVYALSDGQCESLEGVWVNGKYYTLGEDTGDAGRVVTGFGGVGAGTPLLYVKFHSGALDQPADQQLVDYANPAGRWTSDDRLAGICYVRVTCFYDEKAFQGVPQFLWDLKGYRCYDPRKDSTVGGDGAHRWGQPNTYEWAEDAATCLYNYQRGVWAGDELVVGQGLPAYDLSLDHYVAAANACDEDVPTLAGTAEKRYRVAFQARADQTHDRNIDAFLTAMAGSLVERGGVFAVVAGTGRTSLLTITDKDVLWEKGVEYTAKRTRAELMNTVFARFSDPAQNYGSVPIQPRTSAADEAADGGERLPGDFDLGMITSGTQAQRVAEIFRRRSRAQAKARLALPYRFRELEAGDWITWQTDRYGNTKLYEVESRLIDEDQTVQVVLQEVRASIYSWVPGFDEYFGGEEATGPQPGTIISTVPGFWAVPTVVAGTNGQQRPGILVTWSPITDRTVDGLKFEYRTVPGGAALVHQVDNPGAGQAVILNGIQGNTPYEVRADLRTTPPRATTWTDWHAVDAPDHIVEMAAAVIPGGVTFTALDPTPPAVPTGLSVSSITQRTPSGDVVSTVTATCNASLSDNFGNFEFEVSRNGGAFFSKSAATPRAEWTEYKAGDVLVVRVKALSVVGFPSGYITAPAHTVAANTVAPGPPTSIVVDVGLRQIVVTVTPPNDSDFEGIELWESATNNFADALPIYDTSTIFTRPVAPGATRFFWAKARNTSNLVSARYPSGGGISGTAPRAVEDDLAAGAVTAQKIATAAIDNSKVASGLQLPGIVVGLPSPVGWTGPKFVYDTLTEKLWRWTAANGGNWTAEVPAVDITGQIVRNQIAAAAIDNTKVASGLQLPGIVVGLPSPVGWTGSKFVYDTLTEKLWRWTSANGGDWTAAVPAADITGQLVNAQIAAVAASKVTGQLTNGQLQDIAAAKVTGQIVGTQIQDNAISTPKLMAGSVTTAVLAAGAVVAATLAAGAVTTAALAAGAVTTAALAAGSVQAGNIAAGAVTASKLSIGQALGNIVPNGDFEEATPGSMPNGWTLQVYGSGSGYSGAAQAAGAIGGTNRLLLDRGPSPAGVGLGAVSGLFPINGGETYELAAALSIQGATPDGVYVLLHQYDAALNYLTAGGPTVNGPGAVNWTRYKAAITTHADARQGRVELLLHYWASASARYLIADDVTLRRQVGTTTIQDGSITTDKLVANAITAGKVAAGAIGTTQLAAGAVTAGVIAAGAVTTAALAAGAVTAGTIAAGAVTTAALAANAVTAGTIAAGAIGTTQLAASAVQAGNIAAGAIIASKLAVSSIDPNTGALTAGAVGTTTIQDGAVTTAKVVAGAIVTNHMAAGTINADRLTAASITAVQLAADSVTTAKLAAGAVTASKITVGPHTASVIINGDFEEGTDGQIPTAWVGGASHPNGSVYGLTSTLARSGIRMVVLNKGHTNPSVDSASISSAAMFPVEGGAAYELSFYGLGSAGSTGGSFGAVNWYDANGSYVSTSFPILDQPIGGPTRYAGLATSPSNATKATVQIINHYSSSSQYFYVDVVALRRAVGSTIIEDFGITTPKLAAGAVTAAKIISGQAVITETAQLANAIITTAKIADAQITSAKIGSLQVLSANIADLNVGTIKIATGAVSNMAATSGTLQANTVTLPMFVRSGSAVEFLVCATNASPGSGVAVSPGVSQSYVVNRGYSMMVNSNTYSYFEVSDVPLAQSGTSLLWGAQNWARSIKITGLPEGTHNFQINTNSNFPLSVSLYTAELAR
jgi:hypothetical protein